MLTVGFKLKLASPEAFALLQSCAPPSLKRSSNEPMKHILILHASADAGVANRSEGDLCNAGHETKVDTRELKSGDDAIMFMSKGI